MHPYKQHKFTAGVEICKVRQSSSNKVIILMRQVFIPEFVDSLCPSLKHKYIGRPWIFFLLLDNETRYLLKYNIRCGLIVGFGGKKGHTIEKDEQENMLYSASLFRLQKSDPIIFVFVSDVYFGDFFRKTYL